MWPFILRIITPSFESMKSMKFLTDPVFLSFLWTK